jgi:polar amino acid transport system substrate-binding protein
MKRGRLGSLLLAAWVVAAQISHFSVAEATENIRVRVTEFAPNYFMKDGKWTGLDIELAQAVVAEAGFAAEFLDLPWSRALSYLQNGQLDMMTNLSRTPDREVFLHFIGPERVSKRRLVVRKENVRLKIESLDDLVKVADEARMPFGIQNNAKYSDAFDARLAADVVFAKHFDKVSSGTLLPNKVVNRHNLGFFEDENYVAHQLKHSPDFLALALHPFVLSAEPVYFGLGKHLAPETREKLDAALQRLEKNGTLTKIREKWGSR